MDYLWQQASNIYLSSLLTLLKISIKYYCFLSFTIKLLTFQQFLFILGNKQYIIFYDTYIQGPYNLVKPIVRILKMCGI